MNRQQVASLCTTATLLAGCISDHAVTTRPEYAYPQNLQSLCGQSIELTVSNIGTFESMNRGMQDASQVLLSAQLVSAEPALQRRFQQVRLSITPTPTVTVTAYDDLGQTQSTAFGPDLLGCGPDGELVLQFPSSSFYFWASVGTKAKTLSLWTTTSGGLVIQNRWQENHVGIVGGSVSGDAWARFEPASGKASPESKNAGPRLESAAIHDACPELTGDYGPRADVVNVDGSLDRRYASDQFFREELIGPHPVNQEKIKGNRLHLDQDKEDHTITITLYRDETPLVSRTLASSTIKCDAGRWYVSGEMKVASAWLLMVASAGVSWEDLTLWRDDRGDLLIEGTHKRRSALFLIPLGDTRKLFMAFPKREMAGSTP